MSAQLKEGCPVDAPLQVVESAGESAFKLAVRRARALTSSTIVPDSYRGEQNLGNALIALEIADRIGAAPLQVMQNLYIVHGRSSWASTFLIATVNACGRFTPMRFETRGDDPEAPDYRVRAVAKEKDSGDVLEGPWITWKMVNAEGWASKNGSKWKSIPALMFMYRAATFWTRLFAPELSLGMHTTDEIEDVQATTGRLQGMTSPDLADLNARLRERAALDHQPTPAADSPAASSSEASDAPAAGSVPTGYVCDHCLCRSEADDHCTHCGTER